MLSKLKFLGKKKGTDTSGLQQVHLLCCKCDTLKPKWNMKAQPHLHSFSTSTYLVTLKVNLLTLFPLKKNKVNKLLFFPWKKCCVNVLSVNQTATEIAPCMCRLFNNVVQALRYCICRWALFYANQRTAVVKENNNLWQNKQRMYKDVI